MSEHDLVILGGGSGGYAAALRAAELGLSVALVEQAELGGTCLHRGCIPTKAWLHAAEVADAAREGESFGVRSRLDGVDAAAVGTYASGVVDRLYKGLRGLIRSRDIEVVQGSGRLTSPRTVEVDGRTLTGGAVVLATGSQPRTIPGVTPDGERILTSEHALRLAELPRRAIVLGGGVIGVEFASAWRSLGVEVTIVEALDRLVPAEEPELSKALTRAFTKRGISARTGAAVDRVTTHDDRVEVTVGGDTLTADVLLVAVGRGPVSAGLGYEEAGITLDRGFVPTDENLRTTVDGVYAVGDLVWGLQLAHRGFAHGIFVAEHVAHSLGRLETAPVPIRDVEIPRVTYSDPEIASVGLGEQAAREQHGEIETFSYDLAGNGRSQILRTAGLVKVVRVADGPVVGVHMVGARVGELVGEAQLITAWGAWPQEVAPLVHAHPTQGEALGEAHLALAGKPLHVHA